MQVDIVTRPALRVGAVRHIGPYDTVTSAFERLQQIVSTARLQPEAMLGIYHDDPQTTAPDELRSDAAVVVPEGVPLPDGLEEGRVPGGLYARFEHVGPYEALGGAWRRLIHEWLPQHGYRLGNAVSYECYLNTPGTVPPEQLRTELFAPIA